MIMVMVTVTIGFTTSLGILVLFKIYCTVELWWLGSLVVGLLTQWWRVQLLVVALSCNNLRQVYTNVALSPSSIN